MLAKKYPILGSSVDPEKLSLTLKALVPLVIALAALKGIDLKATEFDTYISAIVAIVSGFATLYGLGRRLYVYFKTRQP